METRIVNHSGSMVVLWSQYRTVWEEPRLRLGQDESVVVRWAPEKPYERLGVFVETRKGQLLRPNGPLLLIGQGAIANNQEIVISRRPSHFNGGHSYHMDMIARKRKSSYSS